jgi:hypothetical protein
MVDTRQHILSLLEEKGIINKFKSDLRKEVLHAMNKSLEKPEVLANLESSEAQTCLELIYDFLEHAKLTNTLEIFSCEANVKKRPTRHDLEYKTSSRGDPGKPVLFSLLEKSKQGFSPEQSFDMPKSKFPAKMPMKIPEIGLVGKKELDPKPLNTKVEVKAPEVKNPEITKPVEKPNILTSLPKPAEKPGSLKLQPLASFKKPGNFRGFDLDEEKPVKKDFDSDESIDESIEQEEDESIEEEHKEFLESQATSSMGVDASVNSLALEDFDHVENVRAPRKK